MTIVTKWEWICPGPVLRTWLEKDGRRLVACAKELYPLPEKGCVNNQTWEQPKFFFAVIRKGAQLFADYLQPWFANLDDLHKLK